MQKYFLCTLLIVLISGCSKYSSLTDTALEASSKTTCPQASASLKNAENFVDLVNLINSLPKPLTVECLLSNYDAPLDLHATDSQFSAQPAEGPGSPRVFIFKNNFILSVVPTNNAQPIMEFSLVTGPNQSVKGELEFPIVSNIDPEDPFLRIKSTFNNVVGTNCRFCHGLETPYGANGFYSSIIAPDPLKKVSGSLMTQELKNCDPKTEPQRCRILKVLYDRGFNDKIWPF